VRREYELKNDEPMMKNFVAIVESELADLKSLMVQIREELRGELEYSMEMIEAKKRELLRKFINGLGKEKVEELVLASRVVDYIVDELVIRKETFEKMSKDKLLLNLRTKIDAL
jgi:predicted RNA-binding protein with EMAP domain